MELFWAILLSALTILILGALRARLYFEFAGLSALVFGSTTVGKWFYTLLFLPGTILHELSHWLMAELLGVKTGEITVLPDFSDTNSKSGQERLGSVQTANAGPLRSFLIGSAPFLTGVLILWVIGHLILDGGWLWWQYLLLLYGVVVVGSSMLLSKEDRRSWPFILILLIVIIVIYYLLPITLPEGLVRGASNLLNTLNQILLVTSGAILVIISISYGFRRIMEKILGKKVIRR